MFSVYCPRHQRRVLLTSAEIVSLSPAAGGGFDIGYRCFCGYEGRWPPSDCDEHCEESWNDRMAG
jgi:hypothetical protein